MYRRSRLPVFVARKMFEREFPGRYVGLAPIRCALYRRVLASTDTDNVIQRYYAITITIRKSKKLFRRSNSCYIFFTHAYFRALKVHWAFLGVRYGPPSPSATWSGLVTLSESEAVRASSWLCILDGTWLLPLSAAGAAWNSSWLLILDDARLEGAAMLMQEAGFIGITSV